MRPALAVALVMLVALVFCAANLVIALYVHLH